MIKKERLEELIEQGATIYVICWGRVKELNLNDVEHMEEENGDIYYEIADKPITTDLSHLFETKEDAEEYAEFGDITRTERLELPSWELFKGRYKGIGFKVEDYIYKCFTDGIEIEILEFWGRGGKSIFKAPLTRENYNEARRLCVKLFKG